MHPLVLSLPAIMHTLEVCVHVCHHACCPLSVHVCYHACCSWVCMIVITVILCWCACHAYSLLCVHACYHACHLICVHVCDACEAMPAFHAHMDSQTELAHSTVCKQSNTVMIACMQAAAVNTNTPIVVVLIHGGPLDVSWMDKSDRIGAIMSAWYPGQVSLYPSSLFICLYLYQACSHLLTQLIGRSAQSDCTKSDWSQSAALHGWYKLPCSAGQRARWSPSCHVETRFA